MALTLDHIVIGAADLAQGRTWALERLGAEPAFGGRHALMGTHNLLVRLDDPAGSERYLEIVTKDPAASKPARPRWFDMDQLNVRTAIDQEPTLLAWVARTDDIVGDRERLMDAGLDPGPVVAASRETPEGLLRWRITIPIDGARVAHGAVPMLITWEGRRPAASLPSSGVSLDRLVVRGLGEPLADELLSADAVVVPAPGPALEVTLRAGAGSLILSSID
ncbi:MAG: VOC family protein [Chloroflexi bacterium]|nr:VOC family protein [Chloroflexota bacterium]